MACDRCGRQHTAGCKGHRSKNHATDPGGPCGKSPMRGQDVCAAHGGRAPQNLAAAEKRLAEQAVEAQARKLIPDAADRTPITNPLERLLELASEADAFRESLRLLANKLDDDIRAGGTTEQLRAEVATYRQAFKDTTDVLVAIARLDIEKMLARIESRKVELVLEAMNAGCDAAQLDPQVKATVMDGVGRHLRLVRRPAA